MLRLTQIIALFSLLMVLVPVYAANTSTGSDTIDVLKQFNEDKPTSNLIEIDTKTKHKIMFYMAVPLLILLIATVILGVAMAIFGKEVFVAHMVCAGLSVCLAIAHAIVGIVWFAPW